MHFVPALYQFYHGLGDYGCRALRCNFSIYSIYSVSQRVRWVSISRWRAMACVVNVLSTATQRPELPSPAPATPTTIEQQMTHQQLHAPVSTHTDYTTSPNLTGSNTSEQCKHTQCAHKHTHTKKVCLKNLTDLF